MFVLALIEDDVKIMPQDFRNEIKTIEESIERKYCGKVLLNVGLCIGLHDIIKMGDGIVFQGEGASQVKVTFRLTVFKPFVGEIISGKLIRSTPASIQIDIEFFDEIYVNASLLPNPVFDEKEGLWFWNYDENHMYFELQEPVRFRVEKVQFNPPVSATYEVKAGSDKIERTESGQPPPMQIFGSMRDFGLGMASWWAKKEETQEEEEEETQMQEEEAAQPEGEETGA
eukprot:Phypoly_transcript_17321.p1 GENE.Phypoly_transcript_17321~~Phypoly_transcript_17321.p1  ORF type:complete len:228 (+),score=46.59 Phypoly_transcript_17321:93-776(+)